MASPFSLVSPMKQQLIIYILLALAIISNSSGCYKSIFSFGDSLADTGNLLLLSRSSHLPHFAYPPYGETFFHKPTGRCSDGRLVIDFIAEYLGLPLVPPYFGGPNGSGRSFQEGVNFAVAGATAIDAAFLEAMGIPNPYTNISLGVQLGLFKELLPSLCFSSSERTEPFRNSLILMGEIGGNDYNYPFFLKKNFKEIQDLVPLVVNAIGAAITELIELGAVTLLVPGNLPIGCSSAYLTIFKNLSKEAYDPLTGCLKWLNNFSEYHNELLQIELNQIRELHPQANIIYADYYNAAMQFYKDPGHFGFIERPLKACCGSGGEYNYNSGSSCGSLGVRPCDDPSSYVSWDGIHLTEAAYRIIAKSILEGPYTSPRINISCLSLTVNGGIHNV